MTSRISREWLAAAAGLTLAFLGVAIWARYVGALPLDLAAMRLAVRHAGSQTSSDFYSFFAGLGSPAAGTLATFTAVAIVLRNVGGYPAALVLMAAAIALLEPPLSDAVGMTAAAREAGIPPGGFPSGHVLFITPVGGMIAWLALQHGRREVAAVAIAVVVLMGVTRVMSRAHLVDEVVASYLLGSAWLCVLLSTSTGPRLRPTKRRT